MQTDRICRKSTKRLWTHCLMVFAMALSSLTVGAGAASAATNLGSNQVLYADQSLDNWAYHLKMQGDGNLVLYWGSTAIWSPFTNTPGSRLVMQNDGNLVVYRPNNTPAWWTGTGGTGAVRLHLGVNGEVYMTNYSGAVVWQLGTRAFGQLVDHRPPDTNHTWATSLPSKWTYPSIWAMSTLNWTDLNTTQVSNPANARVWMKEDPNMSSDFLALTPCVNASNGLCYKYHLDINPDYNPSDLEAIICHEAGHTAGLAHDDSSPLYRNSLYLDAEKSCLRGNPDVHQYGVRRVSIINSLV